MYQKLVANASLPTLLREVDRLSAEERAKSGCGPCGGVLDRAEYPRRPRGPWTLGREHTSRESFCCRDCRKRMTPPSVLFFGRRWYVAPVVVLVAALVHGPTPPRLAHIREVWGVSADTVRAWRRWWRIAFTGSAFWKAARGYLARPVSEAALPLSLAALFENAGEMSPKDLQRLLRWLSPVTTRPWLEGQPLCGTV